MSRRTTLLATASTATVTALVTALVVGGATAPADAGVRKGLKAKLSAIAAKVVDEKAPTLAVKHAATADRATVADRAISATTAGDAATLGGKAPSAYEFRVASIGAVDLVTTPAQTLRFTVKGLPLGASYLLSYNLVLLKTDAGAKVSCWVDFSNRRSLGASSGNDSTTFDALSGQSVVQHFDDGIAGPTPTSSDHEPQVGCSATSGMISVLPPKQGRASSILLTPVDGSIGGVGVVAEATSPMRP
jgi:hypothetical protein